LGNRVPKKEHAMSTPDPADTPWAISDTEWRCRHCIAWDGTLSPHRSCSTCCRDQQEDYDVTTGLPRATSPDPAVIAASLTGIVEKMCAEYDRDQYCDYVVINGLIEEAGSVIGHWQRNRDIWGIYP
jgi:hypothetical protein